MGDWYPRSVTEGPSDTAYIIDGTIWKAYGRACGGAYVHELLGRPTEYESAQRQDFENGHILRSVDGEYAWAYLTGNVLVCYITGLVPWHTGPCWDADGTGMVDLPNEILGTILKWSNNPVQAYDERYDVNRDEWIDLPNDILGVILAWYDPALKFCS